MFAYLRIACAGSESELGGDALSGELSADNERAAREMLGRLAGILLFSDFLTLWLRNGTEIRPHCAGERRKFLDASKQAAVDAARNGQETGVRRDVAKLVCDLLDSEGAALDTLAPLIA